MALAFVTAPAPLFQPAAPVRRAPLAAQRPAATGLGLAAATCVVLRGRTVRRLSPRASAELLEKRGTEEGDVADVKPWRFLSGIAKDAARAWFVQRAEDRGIAWRFSVERMQAQQEDLERTYQQLTDQSLEYPEYFCLPFHGYDEGNLSWRAAHELEAATQSMCLGYYDGMSWQEAQETFRGAARSAIRSYWTGGGAERAADVLDMGCSGGFSSEEMAKIFPQAKVTGLDLSPYFLSVAKQNFPEIQFLHANAESTGLPEASYDVITLNFLLHELPLSASRNVVREAYRLLKPGGALVVLDVDPGRLKALPAFRRWAFQVTEPWCKEGEYFSLDLPKELKALNFKDVQQSSNDPVNSLTMARK